ncbi:MAG: hypothetical protein ACI3XR_08615 [Eubacteriales bacterium]
MRTYLNFRIGLILVLCVFLLSSCGKTQCPAVESMEKGTYSLSLDLSDDDISRTVTIAQKDGAVCLRSDEDSFVLFTKNGSYAVDTESKTYSNYQALDLNYDAVFIGKNTLKFKNVQTEDSNTVYRYQVGDHTVYGFVYDSEGNFCELRMTVQYDGKVFSESVMKVLSFSDSVPDEAIFEIPEGYTESASE